MIRNFLTAFRFLTILPIYGKDTTKFYNSLIFFPLVGAFIGVLNYGIIFISEKIIPEYDFITAIAILGFSVVITRAIHLDGLADFCDGFFGGNSKEQILQIMNDPHIGTFGVIAISFDLLTKYIFYYILINKNAFFIIVLSYIISRLSMSTLICFSKYAKSEHGKAYLFFTKDLKIKIMVIISSILCFLITCFFIHIKLSLALYGIAMFITLFIGIFCKIKINGITGDCIGACNEFSEIGALIVGFLLIKN
jgi:adenosylcobinamide-GDP ribazoletransferase